MKTAPRRCILVLCALALTSSTLLADTVIFSATTPTSSRTPPPLYQELSGVWSWQGIHSPLSPGNGCRTCATAGLSFAISPTLEHAGGVYAFDITHGTAGTMTTNIVLTIEVIGGVLVDDLGRVVTSTTAFQKGGDNTWERVGILEVDPCVAAPIIRFTASSAFTNRLFVDGFRFDLAAPGDPHVPSADADADGDVDQGDFGQFQECYTGPEDLISGYYCACFDLAPAGGDGHVDDLDYEAFFRCMTGPAIPWTTEAFPDCVP